MQLSSADTTIFLKKKIFFAPENMKNPPSKLAHNRPRIIFFSTGPAAERPKNRNPVPPKAP